MRSDLAAVEGGDHLAAFDHFISYRSRLHSVGIGELLCVALSLCYRRVIAHPEPRCTP
jgi:hypothetical protein